MSKIFYFFKRSQQLLSFAFSFFIVSFCAAHELETLILEGREIHASLRTPELNSIRNVPDGIKLPKNPQLSSEDHFVEAVSRGGSQGKLGREGIHSALYARYTADGKDLGFYGLKAKSEAEADQREIELHKIWAYNAGLNRARVHREGLVLVVVWAWYSGDTPAYWDAANAIVAKRLVSDGSRETMDKIKAKPITPDESTQQTERVQPATPSEP